MSGGAGGGRRAGDGPAVAVELLTAERARGIRPRLAAILADCVAGGASIGFMAGFDQDAAIGWWDGVIPKVAAGEIALFGGFVDGEPAGAVMLGLDMPPNQQHRADLRKLIVHRSARGRGIGAALVAAAEAEARRRGRTLLVLDTCARSDAERLYRRAGWTEAGTVPGYALMPDGGICDTVFYWKRP